MTSGHFRVKTTQQCKDGLTLNVKDAVHNSGERL